ncbi:M3 family metallopeptidase [Massilia sp. W12]|uniref:M3 family metallopeptidase n=1 Tax=Massilia sp. W12 TaxID=3126507 RepID=UPI0030CE65F5
MNAIDSAANPLLQDSSLPYQMPHFDRVRHAHYLPAFAQAMREHLQEVAQIAANPAPPALENTVIALERSGLRLAALEKLFFNLNSVISDTQMQAIENTLAPQLAQHRDEIFLNHTLFARIDAVYQQRAALQADAETLRLLEKTWNNFVREGARLAPPQQARLRELNTGLAVLHARFSQNVLAEAQADAVLVEHESELAGLSPSQIAALAQAAQERGHAGKYLIALSNTSTQPLNTQLHNRALRQRLMQASLQRGLHGSAYDNQQVMRDIARLRAERAQLLGYADYASYSMEDETAHTPQAVRKLLHELAPAALANAKREAAALQDLAGAATPLASWDWDIYAEQRRQAEYAFDESELKPYFELNNVLQNGVFYAAQQLYGISFTPRPDLPVYHPDVKVWEVKNADGTPLALFLGDFYARKGKRGGAWMNEYVSQSQLLGQKPVIGNHMNIPAPATGEPTLLSYDEVGTMFHEFGHALHGMFSAVRYPMFAGTNVPRDFVEFPSQINEMWMLWPQVLTNYARHWQTGAAMPQALVDKLQASKKFNQGYATTEYLAAALLDLAWNSLRPDQIPDDVQAFEAQALQQAGIAFELAPPRYRSAYFSHSFGGGYAAGYYAYLWSEKLDADTEAWFVQNGGLTRANGERFRQMVLARGNSADPLQVYREFRGRDAQLAPLLERRGLDALLSPAAAD